MTIDTEAILRRNVADLELALRTQTERAEAAEAEMAKLAKQEPVAYVKYKATGGNVGLAWMAIPTAAFYPREGEKLYVTPVPAPHKGATHCDGCGLTWLDDGLNPLGCPYCKDPVPAPAVPYGVDEEAANRIALAVYDCKNDICPEPLLYAINRILAAEAHPLSVEGRDALLQSAPQAPAVPELDPMTRLIVSDPKQLKPKKQEPAVPEFCAVEAQLTLAETEMLNAKAWSAGTQAKRHIDFAMTAICCARALLQSAEVTK